MEKKYLTSRLFLVSGISLIICGIVMFCYPLLMPELNQLFFKIIFWTLGCVSLGGGMAFFYVFCFYPVFTKDGIVMQNAVMSSRTRFIKYGDINYATVNKRENAKGHIVLQLHIGFKNGDDFTYTLMTDAGQLEELRTELTAYGVSDYPVLDAIIKKVGDKVYISKWIVALFIGIIVFWVALCVAMYVMIDIDQTVLWVMGTVMLGFTLAILWCSNYVCVEHNHMIIRNILPFFSEEIFFSDIEKVDINEKSIMIVTLKSGDKKMKRILGLLSPNMVEALRIRLKTEL